MVDLPLFDPRSRNLFAQALQQPRPLQQLVVDGSKRLLQLGIMFPEFKDARIWREEGYRRVMHEIVYLL
jgi:hypothetical protein